MVKKIGFSLVFFLSLGAAFAYFFLKSLSRSPRWYQGTEIHSIAPQAEPEVVKAEIQEKIEQQIQQRQEQSQLAIDTESVSPVTFELNEQEINQLVQAKLAENERQNILAAAKSVQTKINRETVAIGTLINPSEIASTSLAEQKALDKLARLGRQDIYVGFEGKPRVEAGKLVFDQNSRIRIGAVSFSVAEAAQKLGVPPEVILRRLELEIDQLQLQDIELGETEAVFKAVPN